jgi:hypothetical protein
VAWSHATGTLKKGYDWQAATLREPTPFTQLGRLYPDPLLERLRVDKIRANPGGPRSGDRRLDVIVGYAARLTAAPGGIGEADIGLLRDAGLADLDILHLNHIVAYYNYINQVANGLGLHTEIPAARANGSDPRWRPDERAHRRVVHSRRDGRSHRRRHRGGRECCVDEAWPGDAGPARGPARLISDPRPVRVAVTARRITATSLAVPLSASTRSQTAWPGARGLAARGAKARRRTQQWRC